MTRTPIDLTGLIPITRTHAAEIAMLASKYACTLTLERDGIILNLKSMIGLLSQAFPKDNKMELVADGDMEQEASEALCHELCKK